ncbi:MAG: LysM peptidoglycan-binding domain-containing protein [Desulfobacterales bacterium]|nr:MAG: LysM peptidoglycan-binding domain-containing protein [Desulfobacterales bacterium]
MKVTVLILIVYGAAGCLPYQQVVLSRDDLEQASGAVPEDAVYQPGAEQTPPASGIGIDTESMSGQTVDRKSPTKTRPRKELSARIEETEIKEPKNAQRILDEALEFCQTSQDFWGQGDFENAVSALDQAYNLILGVGTNDDPKLIQQKEDIRFMICKRMLEIYASRHIVATGNHNAIPMVMNRYVEREIKLFQGLERKFFVNAYGRSGRYRAEIIMALEEAGLPKELSWLPLIESGFKVRALSRARALGLWQFIPSTGYKFGLKRDEWIDERMDVTKSTRAAIDYLKELHNIFGDWTTVMAAYNCGEARVLRVIRNQNINYLDNFWDLFEKLPYETARYVPRFLAALHIITDPQKYGFDLKCVDPPEVYERVAVSKGMRLKDIAKAIGVSDKTLEGLNPELRHKATPPGSYQLKVPKDKGPLLVAKLDTVSAWTPPKRLYAYHRVRRGETLSHLATRYRTSARAIARANNISTRSIIRVGQRLKIPSRGSPRVYAKASKPVYSKVSGPIRYRVRRGDSLWLLARRYNTNIKEIMRLNNLKTTRLHIGQHLVIRGGTEAVETGADTKRYRVRRGDSPYKIARAHNMKLERLLRINNLTPRSKIYPGQLLSVEIR